MRALMHGQESTVPHMIRCKGFACWGFHLDEPTMTIILESCGLIGSKVTDEKPAIVSPWLLPREQEIDGREDDERMDGQPQQHRRHKQSYRRRCLRQVLRFANVFHDGEDDLKGNHPQDPINNLGQENHSGGLARCFSNVLRTTQELPPVDQSLGSTRCGKTMCFLSLFQRPHPVSDGRIN